MFEVTRLSPHVVAGNWCVVVVSDEFRQPPPDRLEIFRSQHVIGVGDAPVVRLDGQLKITPCFVEQKRGAGPAAPSWWGARSARGSRGLSEAR